MVRLGLSDGMRTSTAGAHSGGLGGLPRHSTAPPGLVIVCLFFVIAERILPMYSGEKSLLINKWHSHTSLVKKKKMKGSFLSPTVAT